MRILIVTPEFPPHVGGGIGRYCDLLASALVEAGADVRVLVSTPFCAFDDYNTSNGVRVRFVPLADVERHAERLTHLTAAPVYRRYIAAALAAADVVAALSDVDVIETTDFGLLFAPLVNVTSRPPVVVKMHGSLGQIAGHEPVEPRAALDFALARVTEAVLLPAADRLLAYSPSNADEWGARLNVPVGFLPAPLPPAPLQQSVSTEWSGLVAARIQAWKGSQLLCEALASLGSQLPDDLRIAWAGRDTATAPDNGSLSTWLAKQYPAIWTKRVVPIGQQPAAAIASMQHAVRYVVAPSAWDTFNYTIAESMTAGAVTVASAGAGASYLLRSGENGFVHDAGDARQLGQRLLEAHQLTASERADMGRAARDTVAAELDPQRVARLALDEFRTVTSAPKSARPLPWVRGFFDDALTNFGNEDALLENVGIRTLGRHLRRRVFRRLAGRAV